MIMYSFHIIIDGSVTSLACSSVRQHLAVGLSTGEINVFTGHPSKPAAAPHSIPNTMVNNTIYTS